MSPPSDGKPKAKKRAAGSEETARRAAKIRSLERENSLLRQSCDQVRHFNDYLQARNDYLERHRRDDQRGSNCGRR